MANKSLMLLAYVKHLPHGRDPNELRSSTMFDFGKFGLINIYYSLVGYLVNIVLVFQVLFKFVVEAFLQLYHEIMRAK